MVEESGMCTLCDYTSNYYWATNPQRHSTGYILIFDLCFLSLHQYNDALLHLYWTLFLCLFLLYPVIVVLLLSGSFCTKFLPTTYPSLPSDWQFFSSSNFLSKPLENLPWSNLTILYLHMETCTDGWLQQWKLIWCTSEPPGKDVLVSFSR